MNPRTGGTEADNAAIELSIAVDKLLAAFNTARDPDVLVARPAKEELLGLAHTVGRRLTLLNNHIALLVVRYQK